MGMPGLCLPASAAALVIVLQLPARAGGSDGQAAYALVGRAALDRLPVSADAAFAALKPAIMEQILAPDRADADDLPRDAHYLKLDIESAEAPFAERLAVVRAFPRDRAAALAVFNRKGERSGGRLPWALAEQTEALAAAWRAHDEEKSILAAARLIQLSADACLPFNATADLDGPDDGAWRIPAAASKSGLAGCGGVRGRTQDALIARQAEALRARLDPPRPAPRDGRDVAELAFATLTESWATADLLIDADAQLRRRWDIRDGETFASIAGPYLVELDRRCLELVAARLSAGADLAAGLLARAAGLDSSSHTPPVASSSPAATRGDGPPSSAPSHSSAASAAPSIVGSKSSNKFHRPTCRHAQNIKPENLQTFSSAAEAIQAGREPCAVCKPDSPP